MEKKISLQDLSENLSSRNEMPRKDAELFVRSVFEIIEEYLKTDKMVKIKGLGTFKLVSMDSRESVDVNTGERILINGYVKVSFTPDPVLRDEINKPFSQFETVMLFDKTDLAELEKLDQQTDEALTGIDSDTSEEQNVLSEEYSDEVSYNCSEQGTGINLTEQTDIKEKSITDILPEETSLVDDVSTEQIKSEQQDDSVQRYAAEQMSPEHISSMPVEAVSNPIKESVEAEQDLSSPMHDVDSSASESGIISDEAISPEASAVQNEVIDDTEHGNVSYGESSDDKHTQKNPDTVNVEHLHADYQHVNEQHAEEMEIDHQRVKSQTAGTQHVDMQNVEHQTIENQHIVQMTGDHRSRKKYIPPIWVIILSVLIVLLLMLGSYFVGYYRLLCPSGCETVAYVSRSEVVSDLPVIHPQDSAKSETDSSVVIKETSELIKKDSVESRPVERAQKTNASANHTDAVPKEAASKNIGHSSVQKKKPASIYPQLPGGKYEIIGTLATLRLKSGETLRNLALKYYGSKNYVPYIVIYNKIENPDIIAENTEIKIPELRRKEE